MAISSIVLQTNNSALDKGVNMMMEMDPFQLNKKNPIEIERDFLVDEELHNVNVVRLDLVKIKVYTDTEVELILDLVPFLTPNSE